MSANDPRSTSTLKSCGRKTQLFAGGVLAASAGAILLYPLPAHAYLDPASGSLFLQMLLGGIAGAALLVRMYWRKFLDVLGIGQSENDGEA